ncbi:hypothetical protein BTN49_1272 [Candidatus Enterovibrio escicola]|uniref:Mobile element protein n=1 Tax=Candidatus Enterovibrio escicola TaxID=1927127 RepID=A0A2A5T554_9GAMM|nr:hypothetical protein BTN49_1272 [Candidatus Enterovibrio escacola]
MNNSDAVFSNITDFCQVLLPVWETHRISDTKTRNNACR